MSKTISQKNGLGKRQTIHDEMDCHPVRNFEAEMPFSDPKKHNKINTTERLTHMSLRFAFSGFMAYFETRHFSFSLQLTGN
jgi:hypothetical protein